LLGVGTALVGVGAGLAATAVKGVDFADDLNVAMEGFAFSTGLAGDELEEMRGIATEIFAANWGESIDDVAESMARVRQVTWASGDELEMLTTNALILRDRFGIDVNESIMAAQTLMEQFGLTGSEAYDFIVSGIQQGLDSSGDFLDTVSEYSNLFAGGGASAAQFFSLMETGLQGGVLGTDKAADAFKEFQIRFLEGGDEAQAALEQLTGVSWQSFVDQVGAGTSTVATTFDVVVQHLAGIEDPIERQRLGVALLGTQFEDLGADAVAAISLSEANLEGMIGATERAGQSSQGLNELVEGLGRQFLVAIEPAAATILPLLAEGFERVGAFLERATPGFTEFAGDLETTVGPAMLIIEDAALRIADVLGIATDETSGMDLALILLKGTLDLVVTAIEAVAVVAEILARAFEQAEALAGQLQIIAQFSPGEILQGVGASVKPEGAGQIPGFGFVPGAQHGGVVPGMMGEPQLVMAHGGETFIPTHRPDFEGAMGPSVVEIPVNLEGREIARVVAPLLGEKAKRMARLRGHANL
jgi:hypothetical protein